MKKTHILSAILLIFVCQAFAQQKINSGSFQFTFNNTRDKKIEKIQLESIQKIEEQNISNILIINLLPGEYKLTVQYKFHNVSQTATQNILIEQGKRIVCTLNEKNLLSFNYIDDNNSMQLVYYQNTINDLHNIPDFEKENHRIRDHGNKPPTVEKREKVMSDADFNNLYNSVISEKHSSNQIKAIETAADFHKYFTSEQAKQLISILKSDNDKLTVAKYLAPKVIDIQNLPYIKDVFTFSSTKNDYLEFIKSIK